MEDKIIINGLFYIALTSFFLFLFIKEKKMSKKLNEISEKISEKIILIFNSKGEGKIFKKIISTVTNILVALALVVVIQRFYVGNFVIPTGSMIPTIEIKDRIFADMVSYKFREPRRNEIIVFKEPIKNKDLYTKRAMGLPGEKISIRDRVLYIDDKPFTEREYSNLGIENQEWIVPKKGDNIVILPAGNYKEVYESYNIDVAKIQEDLKKYPEAIKDILPNLKFIVNGKESGIIFDYIHDEKILNKILNGETVEMTSESDYILALGDNTDYSFDSRFWGFVSTKKIRGKAIVRFWPLNRIGLLK